MLCGDLNGKEIQKREDMFIHAADSLCCTVWEYKLILEKKGNFKKQKQNKNGQGNRWRYDVEMGQNQ